MKSSPAPPLLPFCAVPGISTIEAPTPGRSIEDKQSHEQDDDYFHHVLLLRNFTFTLPALTNRLKNSQSRSSFMRSLPPVWYQRLSQNKATISAVLKEFSPYESLRMWAVNEGKKPEVRKGLVSLKKPFHFLQELICLPISTAHGCLSMILSRNVFIRRVATLFLQRCRQYTSCLFWSSLVRLERLRPLLILPSKGLTHP